MNASPQIFEFLRQREVLKIKAYKPTPNDIWTIGYGHTLHAYQGQIITPFEAEEFLKEDVQEAENKLVQTVNLFIRKSLTQYQYDAIVSLLFNIPFKQWKSSNALSALNDRDFARFEIEAFSEQYGWTKQAGKILPGLVNRRAAELLVFQTGNYSGIINKSS